MIDNYIQSFYKQTLKSNSSLKHTLLKVQVYRSVIRHCHRKLK